MNPIGKLFYEKIEEENDGLGDRIIFIAKRADRSSRNEEERKGNILIRKRDRGGWGGKWV